MANGNKDGGNIANTLDRSSPAAADAVLGTWQRDITQKVNDLLTKLDGDAGVTDTNYSATLKVTAPEDR